MNILFFLTPKSEVAYISEEDTLRQALEKMEYHKYSAIPIISRTGRYIGTLTEGDLLWGIKNQYHLDLKGAEKIPITAIKRRLDNRPVKADADMEDLIGKALNQNFVPVLDDQKCFIGIITRKDIIQYFYKKSQQPEEKWPKSQKQLLDKMHKRKKTKIETLCTLFEDPMLL
jgi:CBS domain-containing protein